MNKVPVWIKPSTSRSLIVVLRTHLKYRKNHWCQKVALIPVLLGLLQRVAEVWQRLNFQVRSALRSAGRLVGQSVGQSVGGDHAKEAIISDGGPPSVQRCNVSNASLKFNCKPVTMIPTLSFWDNQQTLKLIVYPHNKLWLGTAAFAILYCYTFWNKYS